MSLLRTFNVFRNMTSISFTANASCVRRLIVEENPGYGWKEKARTIGYTGSLVLSGRQSSSIRIRFDVVGGADVWAVDRDLRAQPWVIVCAANKPSVWKKESFFFDANNWPDKESFELCGTSLHTYVYRCEGATRTCMRHPQFKTDAEVRFIRPHASETFLKQGETGVVAGAATDENGCPGFVRVRFNRYTCDLHPTHIQELNEDMKQALVVASGKQALHSIDKDHDFYTILGFKKFQDVTKADVDKARRRLAVYCHPDKSSSHEDALKREKAMTLLNAARDTLGDPAKKKQYDQELYKDEYCFWKILGKVAYCGLSCVGGIALIVAGLAATVPTAGAGLAASVCGGALLSSSIQCGVATWNDPYQPFLGKDGFIKDAVVGLTIGAATGGVGAAAAPAIQAAKVSAQVGYAALAGAGCSVLGNGLADIADVSASAIVDRDLSSVQQVVKDKLDPSGLCLRYGGGALVGAAGGAVAMRVAGALNGSTAKASQVVDDVAQAGNKVVSRTVTETVTKWQDLTPKLGTQIGKNMLESAAGNLTESACEGVMVAAQEVLVMGRSADEAFGSSLCAATQKFAISTVASSPANIAGPIIDCKPTVIEKRERHNLAKMWGGIDFDDEWTGACHSKPKHDLEQLTPENLSQLPPGPPNPFREYHNEDTTTSLAGKYEPTDYCSIANAVECHHITPTTNVAGILDKGLKTSHGGTGGASDLFPDAKTRKKFKDNSKGAVHVTKGGDKGKFYEDYYAALGVECTNVHVYPQRDHPFRPDPDDLAIGRFKTEKSIPFERVATQPYSKLVAAKKDEVSHARGRLQQQFRMDDLKI